MFESACAIVIISYSSRAFGIIPHATWSIFLLITGSNWGARFIREERTFPRLTLRLSNKTLGTNQFDLAQLLFFGTKNGCSRLLVSLYLTRYHLCEILPKVNLLLFDFIYRYYMLCDYCFILVIKLASIDAAETCTHVLPSS